MWALVITILVLHILNDAIMELVKHLELPVSISVDAHTQNLIEITNTNGEH